MKQLAFEDIVACYNMLASIGAVYVQKDRKEIDCKSTVQAMAE